LTIRPQHEATLLRAARVRQTTEEFRARYAVRAGIEGTIAQATVAVEMRSSRYRGMSKTHLHHVATAAAINIRRLVSWWNDAPLAKAKPSRFAALMAA
jgi:transposase